MPSLQDRIFVLQPTAQQPRDFLLQDDGRGQGPYLKEWNFQINGVPVPQPTPEELAAVTQEQVDAARTAVARLAATQAALLSTEAADIANRTDARLQWTAINDHAEILGYIMVKLGVTREQFVADITARRDAWKAAVGHDFEQQPTDPGVMFDELTRLAQSLIVQALGAAIIGGVGDPIKV